MPLKRTSVQLSDDEVTYLSDWPGLPMSEALRIVIDRHQFLFAPTAELKKIAERHRKALSAALEGLSFANFELIARSLPSLLVGTEIAPPELLKWAQTASMLDRIAIADLIIKSQEKGRRK